MVRAVRVDVRVSARTDEDVFDEQELVDMNAELGGEGETEIVEHSIFGPELEGSSVLSLLLSSLAAVGNRLVEARIDLVSDEARAEIR